MNSITLNLGKNSAILRFGVVERKRHLSLAAEGPCNKLVFGELGGKQKESRCDAAEPLLVSYAAAGFIAYWVAENHDDMTLIRIDYDAKTNILELALYDGELEDWVPISDTDLAVLPNPEFKFYNYRSEVAAKTLNAPKRPRGRPRKPEAEKAADETEAAKEPTKKRGRPRKSEVASLSA